MNIQNLIESEKQRKQLTPSSYAISLLKDFPKEEAVYAFLPRCLVRESMTFDECYNYLHLIWNDIPICIVTSDMIGSDIDVKFPFGSIYNVPVRDSDFCDRDYLCLSNAFGSYIRRAAYYDNERQYILIFADRLQGKGDIDPLFVYAVMSEMTRALLDSDVNDCDLLECANFKLLSYYKPFSSYEQTLANTLALIFFADITQLSTPDMRNLFDSLSDAASIVPTEDESIQATLYKSLNWSLNKTNRTRKIIYDNWSKQQIYGFDGFVHEISLQSLTSFEFSQGSQIEKNYVSCLNGITSLDIPEGVTCIECGAIHSCASLTSITIPSTVDYIAPGAIQFCPQLKELSVDPDNQQYYSKDNCIFNRDDNGLVLGCAGSIIPEGTTYIDKDAFLGCKGLTSITIPESIRVIGVNAFSRTSIESIVIPSNVESIQREAFRDCLNLRNITFKGSPVLSFLSFLRIGTKATFTSESSEQIIADKNAFFGIENCATFNFPGGMRKISNIGIEENSCISSIN